MSNARYVPMMQYEGLKQQLRAAKREKRKADKLLKGQALNDSRIIGELKRETRDVWRALSGMCKWAYYNGRVLCAHNGSDSYACTMSNCPLLKRGKGKVAG